MPDEGRKTNTIQSAQWKVNFANCSLILYPLELNQGVLPKTTDIFLPGIRGKGLINDGQPLPFVFAKVSITKDVVRWVRGGRR